MRNMAIWVLILAFGAVSCAGTGGRVSQPGAYGRSAEEQKRLDKAERLLWEQEEKANRALREQEERERREQRQADELDAMRHETEKAREKAREREAWEDSRRAPDGARAPGAGARGYPGTYPAPPQNRPVDDAGLGLSMFEKAILWATGIGLAVILWPSFRDADEY